MTGGAEMTQMDRVDRRAVLRGAVTIAGASVVLPAFASLGGCSSAPASIEAKMPLIQAVSDRVIPATDTPGALTAGVPDYIAAVFDGHFTEEQKADFSAGLARFDKLAEAEGASAFAEATTDQQDAVLAQLDGAEHGSGERETWHQLRDMVIFGFYTSEAGAEELAYEELPGRYAGCLPFEEIGRAWLERGV